VRPCVHELQGVKTTLMPETGRDRDWAKTVRCHARKERVLCLGHDQRITSGPAAKVADSKAGTDCTRRFAETSDSACPAGASIHGTFETCDGNLESVDMG